MFQAAAPSKVTAAKASISATDDPSRSPPSGGPQRLPGRREASRGGFPSSYEELHDPSTVPLYSLVPLHGPRQEALPSYQGVRREDTGEIVSVVSHRYGLVQHRAVAEAVHALSVAMDGPEGTHPGLGSAPALPRERIRLYANGRRMEVKLVIGQKFKLDGANEFYPAVRVFNSLDGAWALRMENFAVRIACTNHLCMFRST